MSMTLEQLEAEALKLTPEERERLADSLYVSLHDQKDVEAAWRDEIARRIAELDSGAEVGIPAEQVFAAVRAELAAMRMERG